MSRKLFFTVVTLLLMLPGFSSGALVALEETAELTAKGTKLPRSTVGQLKFRRCSGCTAKTWRVVAETRYLIVVTGDSNREREVTLDEFRVAFAGSEQLDNLVVFFNPDTREVRRLSMTPGH